MFIPKHGTKIHLLHLVSEIEYRRQPLTFKLLTYCHFGLE